MESVQKSVNLADSVLAAIQLKPGNNNDEDLVGGLTQSICNTLISASSSTENISEVTEELKPQNQFQTARQLSLKNQAQKIHGSAGTGTQSGYNPASQARKLLGAKRRFNDPPKESSGYRDEGRDINTEFR